jgi:16S rRNA (adenine1518-N6/adenine1519-N6)-dimethyltransferase
MARRTKGREGREGRDGRQSLQGSERREVHRARKRFGQHFLEAAWARKVISAIAPARDHVFIEIGPGPGAITRPLAASAAALIACEIDRDLAAALRDAAIPNVEVIEGDFLYITEARLRDALQRLALADAAIRVAGNLPYNVASPILFHLVDLSRQGLRLVDATVMLQREVAERLLARPGTRDYGVLSVLIRHRARVDRLLNLPPGAFRPAPKVHSTVVRLQFHPPEPPSGDEQRLARVTQALFSRRRKTMSNALLAYAGITPAAAAQAIVAAGLEPAQRPETLTVADFVRLADLLGPRTGTPG